MSFLRNSFIGSWVRSNRKKISSKYPLRWVQGLDYEEYSNPKYKYYLLRNKKVKTSVTGYRISGKYFDLYDDGTLAIYIGYCWDGPSGPTVDTASFMRSSGVHDVFFQMMRERKIPDIDRDIFFDLANEELRIISKEDGMMWPRYHWVKLGVDLGGARHARPKST